jgi:hypothetical protein
MDIHKVNAILTILAVRYPRGITGFKEDGGSLTAIPSPSNDLIITHPNLPKDIKDMFNQMHDQNLGQPEVHPVIQEVPNFEGIEHDRKRVILVELSNVLSDIWPGITIADTPGVLIITAPKTDIKSERANRIAGALRHMPGLSLAYIVMPKGTQTVKGDTWKDPSGSNAVSEPIPKEEQQLIRDEIERLIGGLDEN